MQVLSQLSYNPTIGPLIGVLSGAIRSGLADCSAGEFRVPSTAGFHQARLAEIEARAYCSRVNAFHAEYSGGDRPPSRCRQPIARSRASRLAPMSPSAAWAIIASSGRMKTLMASMAMPNVTRHPSGSIGSRRMEAST